MLSRTTATRYYVHGDLHEERPQTYYCARCDQFVPAEHFEDTAHVKIRAEQYRHSLAAWACYAKTKNSKFYRPDNAENVIAELAAADVKAAKSSISPFFCWLLRQVKRNDPIGDLARDAESDKSFPTTSDSIKTLRSHLVRTRAAAEVFAALDEGWAEFKAKGKVRAGISLTQRFLIFKRDSYRWQLCGASVQDGRKLEVDHKVPVAKGGSNEAENLWTLCLECNRGKGVRDL